MGHVMGTWTVQMGFPVLTIEDKQVSVPVCACGCVCVCVCVCVYVCRMHVVGVLCGWVCGCLVGCTL